MKHVFTFPFFFVVFLLQSCTSNQSQFVTREKFPPGTAHIVGLIGTIETAGSNFLVELTVTQILGYGAASSPIPQNSNFTALATLDAVKTFLSKTNKGESYTIELKLFQGGVDTKDSHKWEIIYISKNN
ncbi:MAG TPA: hypothetical protein PLZ15_04540 [Melioribacteraceae bacterium]|nr:hypothetical protein [Melioribacteraceae bacterium]